MPWHIYIVRCKDDKLYTGITNNIERRLKQHNSGNGCRFTKYRIPVTLLFTQKARTRSAALKREAQIKSYPRKKKLEHIEKISKRKKVQRERDEFILKRLMPLGIS